MFNSNSDEKIIALLIDGDNVPSSYIDAIEQEASIMGRITHKRLYYTYNNGIPNGWADKLNPHSLRPVQVMPYRNNINETVKNVADAALIVDAMDIMYQGTVNTVFIVASDSDYTVLVKRLKEDGIYVIGAGKAQTPHAFVKACNEFKYLEDLKGNEPADDDKDKSEQPEAVPPKPAEDKETTKPKSNAGSATVKKVDSSEAQTTDNKSTDDDAESDDKIVIPKKDINDFIIKIFENTGKEILDSGTIFKTIKGRYPTFEWKNYPGVKRSYDFYDHSLFTVILPTDNIHTNINIQYPAKKKTK